MTVVAGRMAEAATEISHWPEYDYVIVNADLERADRDSTPSCRRAAEAPRRRTGLDRLACADLADATALADRGRPTGRSRSTGTSSARRVGAMPAACEQGLGVAAQRLEALAQHLAALAEGGGRHPLQRRDPAADAPGAAAASSSTTAEVTLGGGVKAAGRRRTAAAQRAPLGEHRQPA